MWFILFPLISPYTWVCRRDWLGTWTCSQLRSIIGLQIIGDVKNPASLVQKSSTIHVLRGLWLTTQRSSRIKDPTLHNLQVRLFLMGLGCDPESWRTILSSLRKGRIFLLQNSIYMLMDQVDIGGLYFSGVPHCLSRGCHSVEGASVHNACARTGEKTCPSQKGHQMKANTWEAAGFSSQILGSGQYSSKSQYFHAPSQNLDQTSVTGNKRVLLHLAN